MGLWFLVFFVTPIVEMYLLIEVGGYIGTLQTVVLVMLTAVIGIALLRRQGFATLTRGIGRLQAGEVPAQEMAEGILLAVAGALLITPGFVTDAVGFALLAPHVRAPIARWLLSRVTQLNPGFDPRHDATGFGARADAKNRIFEGEFERSDRNDKPPAV
ncbi:MAG: FxsA family protein [Gammaproteobacteria bacterium]|nr:FxsA family protein [Gammaproteobacteria bacterium]